VKLGKWDKKGGSIQKKRVISEKRGGKKKEKGGATQPYDLGNAEKNPLREMTTAAIVEKRRGNMD